MDFNGYALLELSWAHVGGDPERQYRTVAGGVALELSVGDFPTEAAYTLLVNGIPAGEFDSWPEKWSRRDVDPSDGDRYPSM